MADFGLVGKFLFVLFGMAALDYAWSRYSTTNVTGRPALASNWAVAITLLSGLTTLEWMKEPLLLIPACIGAWIGTYAAKVKLFIPPPAPEPSPYSLQPQDLRGDQGHLFQKTTHKS